MSKSPKPTEHRAPRRQEKPGDRGFAEIPIHVLGHQAGRERTALLAQRGHEDQRSLDAWRHNLSAFSQIHNLFFLANGPDIEVFQPEYPSQRVAFPYDLIIYLPVSKTGLYGHMGGDPHAVNHVMVTELGEKEILLCACDDGDVIAYHTDSIFAFLEMSGSTPYSAAFDYELRPFFHTNVGLSAWGLAVHKEARLIAVSCNTHAVTVFAFALKSPSPSSNSTVSEQPLASEENESDSSYDEDDWPVLASTEVSSTSDRTLNLLNDRKKNFRIVLTAHGSNIPSISFCNTPDDPHGAWLVSTTIAGYTTIWNIKGAYPQSSLLPGLQINPARQGWDKWRGGWGVAWIDERAFSHAESVVEAMGTGELLTKDNVAVIDTSHSRTMVKHNTRWKIGDLPQFASEDVDENETQPNGFSSADEDESDEEDDELGHEHVTLSTPRSSDGVGPPIEEVLSHNRKNAIPERTCREVGIVDASLGHRTWPSFALSSQNQHPYGSTPLPKAPLLLLNKQAVQILQNAALERRWKDNPVVYLEDPLRQDVEESIGRKLDAFDRLNLFMQIPELGILLLGSPKGRVAVLTLHRLVPHPIAKAATSPLYTMRLDHILPLSSQEDKLQRPAQQLVGIAASRLQGRSPGETPSRWRIFLTYRDHTILTYEIGKRQNRVFGFDELML